MSILSDSSNLLPFDGTAYLVPDAFPPEESNEYFAALQYDIAWKQESIKIFGKEVLQPRLTAWYGDEDKMYAYSGVTMKPLPWINTLLRIKERVEHITSHKFNSVLLNFYRNGQDSMGWHRDNEKELGTDPVIASISFGATRKFQFRHYKDHKRVISLELGSGSLLLMSGSTQNHWQHGLPKSSMVQEARINLTFRNIIR
ncbi:MAG: alpha-ketoglutarate-dependent dioxygenase AlkB [Taibaiella sp.]|jgi:alkylated DNA repair dioxygenase AlkB